MELEVWGGEEDLGGGKRGEIVIHIAWKIYFQLKKYKKIISEFYDRK